MTYKAPTHLYSIIVHVYDGMVEKPAFVMETGLPLFDAIQIAKSLNIHQAGPGTLYGVQVEVEV